MRTVLLQSLRVNTRRYVAAVLAVVIGVSFIVTTDALASAARSGLTAGLDVPYRGADAVVSGLDGPAAAALIERAAARGESAAVVGWTLQRASGAGVPSEQVAVGVVADAGPLRWQSLEQGRFPATAGEALVDVNDARSNGVALGDRLRIGGGADAVDATVVGTVDTPSASVRAAVYLPWADVAPWARSLQVESVTYVGDPGRPAGATVADPAEHVAALARQLSQGVDVLAYVLLLFAAIALAVSVLVIANTFTILFAQRQRDLALLRCVGATRRQVLRSVRLEALAIGIGASAVGLLVGLGVGAGLVALVRAVSASAPLGPVSFSATWLLAAVLVGVVVTVVAAWLPTRRVVAVSPLVALRPDTGVAVRGAAGRLRMASGLVLVAGGASLLALAVGGAGVGAMLGGGGATFAGLLLLGPIVVPTLIRGVGALTARGPAARLAGGNAVRNPRRTAATTASLLVGVTLTTAVLTGLASSRGAIDDEMAVQHPLDVAVTGPALPASLVDDLAEVGGVSATIEVDGVAARLGGGFGELAVIALPAAADRVTRGPIPPPPVDTIVLPYDVAPDARTITVTATGSPVRLRVRHGEGWGDAGLVAAETLARLAPAPTTAAVWVRATGDADVEDLAGDVAALARPAQGEIVVGLANRHYVDLQLDVLTGAVVGLLGIAVVISLVGIGNTLGLSVLERGREHALLRALGLTRGMLRRSLAIEALLLSVVATVLGSGVGVLYAWVGVQVMVEPVVADAAVVLPWGQLLVVVVVAGLAGLAACVLPARRAVSVPPAAGLALD